MFDWFKSLFSSAPGSPSSTRFNSTMVCLVIIGTWAGLSISQKQLLTMPDPIVWILALTLGYQLFNKAMEAKNEKITVTQTDTQSKPDDIHGKPVSPSVATRTTSVSTKPDSNAVPGRVQPANAKQSCETDTFGESSRDR